MKQTNIPIVLASIIACIALIAVLGGSVFLIAYHIKYNEAPTAPVGKESPAPTTETPEPTDETPTVPATETPTVPATETPAPTTETPKPATTTIVDAPYILSKTSDAGQSYIDSLTFLGDSTTYHLMKNGILSEGKETTRVWFGSQGTLTLKFATANYLFCSAQDEKDNNGKLLFSMASEKKPSILVITLGLGISYNEDKDVFKASYDAVIDTVLSASPETKIICQSIYPITRQSTSTSAIKDGMNNEDIRKANRWIAECVEKWNNSGENVYYLDSFSILVDEEGYLPDNYSNGDGVHLTDDAYDIILENLRTHKIPD